MTIKFQLDRVGRACLDYIRTKSTATDAVVVLIDEATGEFKVMSLRGELTHMYQLIKMTENALQKQKRPNSPIILPN